MARLVGRDYERLLELAASVVEGLAGPAPWPVIAAELTAAMRADIVGFVDVRPPGVVTRRQTWPSWMDTIEWDDPMVAAHPLVRHYRHHADTRPRTVTEVARHGDWTGSAVYHRARTDLRGATQQLAIPLGVPNGHFASVTLGRAGTDFDQHQRLLARRLQPLLVGLDRHLRAAARWQHDATPGAVDAAAAFRLTAREVAVLELLARGLTAEAIGRRLRITAGTVSKHQQHLYRKLGTTDRLSTVLYACEVGILAGPDRTPLEGDRR